MEPETEHTDPTPWQLPQEPPDLPQHHPPAGYFQGLPDRVMAHIGQEVEQTANVAASQEKTTGKRHRQLAWNLAGIAASVAMLVLGWWMLAVRVPQGQLPEGSLSPLSSLSPEELHSLARAYPDLIDEMYLLESAAAQNILLDELPTNPPRDTTSTTSQEAANAREPGSPAANEAPRTPAAAPLEDPQLEDELDAIFQDAPPDSADYGAEAELLLY